MIAVAAGGSHSLALKSDGSVWAWGANGSGQLGNHSKTDSLTPVRVSPFGSGASAIATGCCAYHSLAIGAPQPGSPPLPPSLASLPSLPSLPLVAAVGKETISPYAFPAAPSGPSARVAEKKRRRSYGTKITYTLNEAASVTFTVVQPQPGLKAKGGRCVKPTKANRRAHRCTRLVTLSGSFTRAGNAGTNSFRFTGRLAGRRLKPGKYQLVATPSTGGKTGRPASASFRIIR